MSQPDPNSGKSMDLTSLATALVVDMIEEEANAPRNLGCPYRGPKLINDLPDKCLEAVLIRAKFPMEKHMQKLITKYRLVCKRWCGIIEAMCQVKVNSLNVCDDNFLHLSTGPRGYDFYQYLHSWSLERFNEHLFYDFNLKFKRNCFINLALFLTGTQHYDDSSWPRKYELESGPSPQFSSFLMRLFPSPTELIIDLSKFDAEHFEEHFANVLNHWAPELITLSLKFDSEVPSLYGTLSNFINSCTSLKRLILIDRRYSAEQFLPWIASTLKRIEHFSIRNSISTNEIFKYLSINPAAFGTSFTRLYCERTKSDDIQKLCNANPAWMSNITHLRLELPTRDIKTLPLLAKHFSSLKVLWLFCDKYDNDFFEPLAPLVNLIELRIDYLSMRKIVLPRNHTPMRSVRKLYLKDLYWNNPHGFDPDFELYPSKERIFFTALASYFPNLEQLELKDLHISVDFEKYSKFSQSLKYEYSLVSSDDYDSD